MYVCMYICIYICVCACVCPSSSSSSSEQLGHWDGNADHGQIKDIIIILRLRTSGRAKENCSCVCMCVCVCVCVCVHRHTVRVCVCVCCQHSIIQQRASVQVMKTKMPTLLRRTGASRTASKCQGQVPGQRKTITGWVGGGGGGGFVSIHTMEGLKAQEAGKKEAMMESHYWSI